MNKELFADLQAAYEKWDETYIPECSDETVCDIYPEMVLYRANVAGYISQILAGKRADPTLLKDIWGVRAQLEEIISSGKYPPKAVADAKAFIDYIDRLEELADLAKRTVES